MTKRTHINRCNLRPIGPDRQLHMHPKPPKTPMNCFYVPVVSFLFSGSVGGSYLEDDGPWERVWRERVKVERGPILSFALDNPDVWYRVWSPMRPGYINTCIWFRSWFMINSPENTNPVDPSCCGDVCTYELWIMNQQSEKNEIEECHKSNLH